MQFFGRKFELEGLEDIYEKPGFQLIVIYGRRRVGKARSYRNSSKISAPSTS